jgi:hypothetical protein
LIESGQFFLEFVNLHLNYYASLSFRRVQMPARNFTEFAIIPFDFEKSGHISVMASLAGRPARFFLDTGAGITIIDGGVVVKYGLGYSGASKKSGGVGSSSMRMKYIARHSLRLGGVDLSHLKIASLDLSHVNVGIARNGTAPIVGVIGHDVFKKHQAVLDYARRILVVQTRPLGKRR